ncbi:CHAD domain-containing protein [Isoptericola aurantiacus]|uniref:CHAD domain-containing protein n=1 Tax=Isoptericola aurantiacus TaxID=3377839 RepID=UPI00383A32F6
MSSISKGDPAGEVFAVVVAEHVRRIEQRVPAALADEPDGVHRLRTAVRRLRTVLAVYRPVFDRDEAAMLRSRLAELGAVLGAVRDLEVRREDVESVGRSARVPLAARRHLLEALDERHALAHRELVAWCTGPEMTRLTADLVRWAAGPPAGPKAAEPARKLARKRLRKAARRALRAADDVDLSRWRDADGDERDHLLAQAHRLRKAGRRVSHAARAVTRGPAKILGSGARELGAAGKELQSSLGDHRDGLLLAAFVTAVAESVADDGGDRRPYDRLARAAARRGAARLDAADEAVARLRSAVG